MRVSGKLVERVRADLVPDFFTLAGDQGRQLKLVHKARAKVLTGHAKPEPIGAQAPLVESERLTLNFGAAVLAVVLIGIALGLGLAPCGVGPHWLGEGEFKATWNGLEAEDFKGNLAGGNEALQALRLVAVAVPSAVGLTHNH